MILINKNNTKGGLIKKYQKIWVIILGFPSDLIGWINKNVSK